MDENNRKGQFAEAYVTALVAAAGYMTYKPQPDLGSIDLGVAALSDVEFCPRLEFQIKGYSCAAPDGDYLPYVLKIKNFNELRQKSMVPRYLVVVAMPEEDQPWLAHDEKQLTLYRCAYYLSLKGYGPARGETAVTVKIPIVQMLTVETLHTLMKEAASQPLFAP